MAANSGTKPLAMLWSVPIVDYHGLWTIMDYHELIMLIMDYGPSWTIVDYCRKLWIIVDC